MGHDADATRHLLLRRNQPLTFTLQKIDVEHEVLDELRLAPETLRAFGVGYFAGKGIMHDKIVVPFHNADGLLVAYAGYSPNDRSFTYPSCKHFDLRLELFNGFRAEHAGWYMDDVVVVSDIWNVLRLYERGVRRVLALPTETMYEPQLALLTRLVGSGGRVHYVPWTREYGANLERLSRRFHVRLHRYHDGSEDEFLDTVALQVADW